MQKYAYKEIVPAEFSFPGGPPPPLLIETARSGFRIGGAAAKTASEVELFVKGIKPDPKHSYIHLISLGALEWYGPNKRGDSFNESGGVYRPPAPDTPACAEVILEGGLEAFHNPTFMSNGGVYREHRSVIANPANRPLGKVVLAVYNKPMHRGELVVKLDNEEWRDDIETIARGKPVFFSMGCLCATDVCSVCGRRVSPNNIAGRCVHLRRHLKSFMEDGTQVHAITDRPVFYDISRVASPADKIAFSLAKVASDGTRAPGTAPFAAVAPADARRADRLGLLCKLASEEKEMEKNGESLPAVEMDEEEKRLLASFGDDAPLVIRVLHDQGALLPLPQFLCLAGGSADIDDDLVEEAADLLPGIHRDIVGGVDVSDFIEDGTWEGAAGAPRDLVIKLGPLAARHGLGGGPVRARVIRAVAQGRGFEPRRRAVTPGAAEAAKALAREYARYQLSFITANPEPRVIRLAIAANRG